MNVVFAAGGTAGHINPALAVADRVREVFPDSRILFIGTPDGMESRLVVKAGYDFAGVKMAGFQRRLTPRNIFRNVEAAYRYFYAAKSQVSRILRDFSPDIVVGTGGYVTATVLGAAVKLGIKTVTHESNSYPGMATKMLADKADKVLLADGGAARFLKTDERCVVTGNPLRRNIPIEEREAARARLGLPEGFTILSFGGSLGANRITDAVAELIRWEEDKGGFNHIHSYGKGGDFFREALSRAGVEENKQRHIFKDYIDNMYTCMCAADLIISRSGAMTITEITAIGRASILVPFPKAAENHQYYNAKSLEDIGAALIIEDKDLTGERLIAQVSQLVSDTERLRGMESAAASRGVTDAADKILGIIIDLAEGR